MGAQFERHIEDRQLAGHCRKPPRRRRDNPEPLPVAALLHAAKLAPAKIDGVQHVRVAGDGAGNVSFRDVVRTEVVALHQAVGLVQHPADIGPIRRSAVTNDHGRVFRVLRAGIDGHRGAFAVQVDRTEDRHHIVQAQRGELDLVTGLAEQHQVAVGILGYAIEQADAFKGLAGAAEVDAADGGWSTPRRPSTACNHSASPAVGSLVIEGGHLRTRAAGGVKRGVIIIGALEFVLSWRLRFLQWDGWSALRRCIASVTSRIACSHVSQCIVDGSVPPLSGISSYW